jgi:outer membrane protein TolC
MGLCVLLMMGRMKLLTGLILSGCLLTAIYAEAVSSISLKEIVEEARLNNPEIRAQRALFEAAQARISSLRRLMDPVIGVEFAENMRMYSVTQQLPFPTKLSTHSEFARREAEQHESLYRKKEQEVINRVKKGYARLFLIHRKIETVEQSIAFLKQFFHVASQRYAVGKAYQVDVLRAQVELAKAENDLLTLKDEKEITEAQLNTLLNRPIDAEIGTPQELDTSSVMLDTDELYELTREHHPELKAFDRLLKKVEVMVSMARQTYLPDFTFKFTQHEMDGNFTDQRFMVGLTVPLWFWGKQREMVREMDAQLQMAKARYEALENVILLAVREAKVKVDNNHRTAVLYKNSVIPQATAHLRSALAAYEANQVDFLSLLESEKTLIEFDLEYHRAQADFFMAVGDLEEAVGVTFIDSIKRGQ